MQCCSFSVDVFLGRGDFTERNERVLGVLCVQNCFLVLAILTMGAVIGKGNWAKVKKNGKQSTKHIKLWLLKCWRLVL